MATFAVFTDSTVLMQAVDHSISPLVIEVPGLDSET